jgi:hypothetical protein
MLDDQAIESVLFLKPIGAIKVGFGGSSRRSRFSRAFRASRVFLAQSCTHQSVAGI